MKISGIIKLCSIIYLLLVCIGCTRNSTREKDPLRQRQKPVKALDSILAKAKHISGRYPDSALQYMNDCYRESLSMHYNEGVRKSLMAISDLYLSVHPDAEQYISFFRTVSEREESKDSAISAIINLAFAKGHGEKGQPQAALVYGQTALKLASFVADTSLLIRIYNVMGTLQIRLGDTTESFKSWNCSRKLIYATNDTNALLSLMLNEAGGYIQRNDFNKAKQNLSYVSSVSISRKDTLRLVKAGYISAMLNAREGQFQEALKCLDENSILAEKVPDRQQERTTEYWLRAECYVALGNFQLAEKSYLKAIGYAYERKIPDFRLPGLQQALGDFYAMTGAYEKAYRFNKEGIERFLSQLNEHASSEYNNLAVMYKVSEKDKLLTQQDLQLSRQENKLQQRLLWIIILTGTVLLAGIISISFVAYKRKKQQLATLQGHIDGIEEERGRLSRELHDGIISELSAILIKLKTSATDSTQSFNTHAILQELEKSIADLRNTSHNLLPDIIEQAGLIDAVKYFCNRIHQTGIFEVTVLSYGDLPPIVSAFQLNVYRILQELLSNIHKHSDATKVLLQFNATQSQLYITIEDNSTPSSQAVSRAGGGIGNMNISNRLNATNGNWEFKPTDEGMNIYLDFELSPYKIPANHADQTIHS